MDQQKDSCVFFRTVLEAAEELNEKEALELLTTYAHIGLGDNVDLDKCSQIVRVTIKQLVPALSAAERRYMAACNNGKKGKEFGNRGGRPKKGETKEEAYNRRNPSKTPEETPVNIPSKTPVKPLDVDVDIDVDKEEDIDNNKISKDIKYYTYEELTNILKKYCILFINKHRDYNYLLDTDTFKEYYYDMLLKFQLFVNEKLGTKLSIDDCAILILGYMEEERNSGA